MRLDKKLLKQVADNARLKLTEKEMDEFLKELSEVLTAFSKLDEVDTKNIKPAFHPIELKNKLREDNVKKCLTQNQALSNSKNNHRGYFKGPRII